MGLVWEREFMKEVGHFANAHKGVDENTVMAAMLARRAGKMILLAALHAREISAQGRVDDDVDRLEDLRFVATENKKV